jgi:hypothetical protein
MATPPNVADVRAWTGVAPGDLSDEQIQLILDAETALQYAYCYWPQPFDGVIPDGEIPDALAQAILRRCARAFAARGVPLGSLPAIASGLGAEYGLPGAGLLPRYDAEIERYEAPYRVAGIA